jgi:hypothetical protein
MFKYSIFSNRASRPYSFRYFLKIKYNKVRTYKFLKRYKKLMKNPKNKKFSLRLKNKYFRRVFNVDDLRYLPRRKRKNKLFFIKQGTILENVKFKKKKPTSINDILFTR